jgi:hypothetical protein
MPFNISCIVSTFSIFIYALISNRMDETMKEYTIRRRNVYVVIPEAFCRQSRGRDEYYPPTLFFSQYVHIFNDDLTVLSLLGFFLHSIRLTLWRGAGQLVLSQGAVPHTVADERTVHTRGVQAHQLVRPARWAPLPTGFTL